MHYRDSLTTDTISQKIRKVILIQRDTCSIKQLCHYSYCNLLNYILFLTEIASDLHAGKIVMIVTSPKATVFYNQVGYLQLTPTHNAKTE